MHLPKFVLVFLLICFCAVNSKSNVISDYEDYIDTKETEDLQTRSRRQTDLKSNNKDFNISTETQQLQKELDEEEDGFQIRSKRRGT